MAELLGAEHGNGDPIPGVTEPWIVNNLEDHQEQGRMVRTLSPPTSGLCALMCMSHGYFCPVAEIGNNRYEEWEGACDCANEHKISPNCFTFLLVYLRA